MTRVARMLNRFFTIADRFLNWVFHTVYNLILSPFALLVVRCIYLNNSELNTVFCGYIQTYTDFVLCFLSLFAMLSNFWDSEVSSITAKICVIILWIEWLQMQQSASLMKSAHLTKYASPFTFTESAVESNQQVTTLCDIDLLCNSSIRFRMSS